MTDPVETVLEPVAQRPGRLLTADYAAEHPDHAEDAFDTPVIEYVDVDAEANQFSRNIPLQVGEPEHQVR